MTRFTFLLIFLELASAGFSALGQRIDDLVNQEVFRERLLETVDLWNGGLDGESGMGAFRDDWDGLFRTDLTRDFRQANPNADQTVISQSRAIYINVEAYRAADEADKEKYRAIVQRGTDLLVGRAWDPVYGGVFWGLQASGLTPPTSMEKSSYGQVHVIFSLCHAFSITGDPEHFNFAWQVFEQFEAKHADPGHPGGYRPNLNRNYTVELTDNNFDYMLHYFEALLALFDVTTGQRHQLVAEKLATLGGFMTATLAHDIAGERAFVSYWYGDDWQLHPTAYNPGSYWTPSRFATAGHGIEFAWLLSRAVERGFDPKWLETGRKLLAFARDFGINANAGGMLYDRLETTGGVIQDGQGTVEMIWWPQAESARALLHWSFLRGSDDWARFEVTDRFINEAFVDPVYGGWFELFTVSNPSLTVGDWMGTPVVGNKGWVWKVSYHETMYYAEVLRLMNMRDARFGSAMAFTDYERELHPISTSPDGDFDRDGLSNLLEYALGSDARGNTRDPYEVDWDIEARSVRLRYPQSPTAVGVQLLVESSGDLLNWIEALEAGNGEMVDGSGQRVERVFALGDGTRFFRLSARIIDEPQ